MAYFGTTAASSVSNPPVLVSRLAGAKSVLGTSNITAWTSAVAVAVLGIGLWQYASTNLTTDLCSTGFFSDGYRLGMQMGDIMIGTQYTSAGSSFITFHGVLTTTNSTAGWNLSSGGTMTSTFS